MIYQHLGIDYGAKTAGTTALCYQSGNKLIIKQSQKKSDADKFLTDQIYQLNAEKIFIDAPLSLPAAFYGKGKNYSHRLSDRELKAMSPMFLGGLTARAIALKDKFASSGKQVLEVYPKALVNHLKMEKFYKKDLEIFTADLQDQIPQIQLTWLDNWHQADAVLCWMSGWRYLTDSHCAAGDPSEGVIIY